MSHWKRLLALAAMLGLAACGGGGGNSGTPINGGGNGSANVSDLVITFSKDTITNSGTDSVTATVTAVDVNRVGIKGAAIAVAVDSNAVISTTTNTADDAGKITATIGIGADKTTRNITVTAASNGITRSAVLRVVTDPNSTNPTAADLTLVLSAPSITNGGSSTITATATAVDSNRNVVANIPVTFTVDSSATATVSGSTTNTNGVISAAIGIGSDRSNRVITVTATSGTLVRTASFSVTGARLTASASPLVDAASAGNVVEYTLVDFNSIAMVNQPITVTATGLPSASGRTDLNGKFRYTYSAPAVPGTVDILAVAAGDQRTTTVTIAAAGSGVPVAPENPLSISVTPTPSVVNVNTPGSNTNQADVRVLFVGPGNRPVPRMRVRFDLAGNADNTDGTVTWVGNYAYSDANGVARATFTPGLRSSSPKGVKIRACFATFDFGSPNSGCTGSTGQEIGELTVASEALAVNIRTNELVKSGAAELTYIKEFVVMVVDAAGQAKPDVQITPSVDLTGYYKGIYDWSETEAKWVQILRLAPGENYRWNGTAWEKDPVAGAQNQPVCPNEDFNGNGVREVTTIMEDMNGNGELDPRKSDVAVKMVGSNKTDANGLAILQIEYGRNLASWVDFIITVTASGISGTEAKARFIGNLYGLGNLPYPSSSVTVRLNTPAFAISPYGRASVCTNPN